MRGAFQPQAVSLEWHQSPEGQGVLAHLTDPNTGERRQFGILEKPLLPPTVQTINYKLFLSGKTGVGKTTFVSLLSGLSPLPPTGETLGLRVSNVYWPVKIRTQIFLFNLSLWDFGDIASKKYSHIQPVAREGSIGGIFVFSFSDRSSFEDLNIQLAKINQSGSTICPIIVGTRFGAISESEVTQQDITQFELKWHLPVLRIRNFQSTPQLTSRLPTSTEIALILNIICDRVWCHQHQVKPTLTTNQPTQSNSTFI